MTRRKNDAAATRRALMDAAFACLAELGYHRSSTVAVCERAGVARGTMLHHFPSKQALMLASIDDLLMRRAAEFAAELEGFTGGPAELLPHLWSALRGPTFSVWLELAVAARTDDVLGPEFRLMMKRFDATANAVAESLLADHIDDPEVIRAGVQVLFSALNGFALDFLQKDEEEVEAGVQLALSYFSRAFASATGDSSS